MNKICSIKVSDCPQWSPTVPNLMQKTDLLQKDTFVSEVGNPKPIKTWFGTAQGFELRKSRIRKGAMKNLFGKMEFPDGFQSPCGGLVDVPAVGTAVVLTPKMGPLQYYLMDATRTWQCDYTWIIHIPQPLGLSQLIRIDVPEIDDSTITRGIKWKPGGCPTIVLQVGWNADQQGIRNNANRPGNTGLAIRVELLEDNSAENFNGPAKMYTWGWPHNMRGMGWNFTTGNDKLMPGSFIFQPIVPPPPPEGEIYELPMEEEEEIPQAQSDNPAPSAEGAEAGSALQGDSTAEATALESNAPPPVVAAGPTTPAKPQATAAVSQKWTKLGTLNLEDSTLHTLQVVPAKRFMKGEDVGVPFRKHIFCAPSYAQGRLQGGEFRIVSNRPMQLAGMVRIRICPTGNPIHTGVFYHQIGGDPTTVCEWPLAYLNNGAGPDQKFIVSPWRRAATYVSTLALNLEILNSSQDKSPKVSVTVFWRPGKLVLHVPIKPKKRPVPPSSVLATNGSPTRGDLLALCDVLDDIFLGTKSGFDPIPQAQGYDDEMATIASDSKYQGSTYDENWSSLFSYDSWSDFKCNNATSGDEITAAPGRVAFRGIVNPLSDGEQPLESDLGSFWINAGEITLKRNTPTAFTLNLPALLDNDGAGGETAISEFFSRYTDITPLRTGQYGPELGQYQFRARLPTNVVADVKHVCLPPEMNEEAALRIFGLDSILSIAGGALNSIGGPLLSGALDTVGELAGGLLKPLTGAVGALLGGTTEGKAPEAPAPAAEANAPTISGGIPFSRFLEFFKSFVESETNTLAWPTLLLEVVNLFGGVGTYAEDSITGTLYLHIDGLEGNRAAYERTNALPIPKGLRLSLLVDLEQFSIFLRGCVMSDKPHAKKLAAKCLTVLATRPVRTTFVFDLAKLDAIELPRRKQISQVFDDAACSTPQEYDFNHSLDQIVYQDETSS